MNLTQFASIVLVMGAIILPLVLSVYFSEPASSQPEEYDYRLSLRNSQRARRKPFLIKASRSKIDWFFFVCIQDNIGRKDY